MNEQERQYDTYQEGPYWRVNPRSTGESGQGDSSVRAQDGNADTGNPSGLARYGDAQSFAGSQPVAVDFAHRAADEYSRKHLGKPYAPIENTPSSLRKQGAIGRIFKLAATHHPEYKQAVFNAYKAQRPDIAGSATDYDDLRHRAYAQLAHEAKQQFDALPINMSFHRNGEGNYASSQHMLDDVAKNRHLYVYQGGDPHEFLHQVDPRTGLNTNEMFRAVHDFFGHAVHGSSFGPQGEEKAWAAHSGLFTPLAQAALTSETRGQNSMVNYSPLNALLKARAAKLTEAMMDAHRRGDMDSHAELSALKKQLMDSFEFAPQAAVLLPPEFLHGGFKGGIPEYLKHLVVPEHGTSAELVHYSHEPRLSKTDPRMYGTGIRGAESRRLKEAPGGIPRTYFYIGEPKQKESGLGPHRYKTTADRLYDIEQDPEHLHQLAREVNRTPHTAKYNQGIVDEDRAANEFERMAHEYGYKGVINPSRKIASMFDPQEVKSYASGGLVSRVDQVAGQLKRNKGTVPEFLSELASTPGVKKTELEARGLLDPAYLTEREKNTRGMMAAPPQGGVIDRKRFADALRRHAPAPELDIHETSERGYDKPDQYEEHTLPGGENYREVVFTHNPKSGGKFQSSHYNEPNVLAHTRLTDREGPNKSRVLHVEEIQSDWHQAGRKHGYQTPVDAQMLELASNDAQKARIALKHLYGELATEEAAIARGEGDPARKAEIARQLNETAELARQKSAEHAEVKQRMGPKVPDAPFKKDWHEMVLRHLMAHAAAEGYDAIAVTPGEEQAKRYDLSKHIGEVHHSGSDFVAYSPEGKEVIKQTGVRPEDLPDLIGKELADKLMAQKPQGTLRSLRGQDIKVGGEGMKGFYDHMIPLAMNKIGKKYGVQVTPQAFEIPHPPITTGDILDDMAARGHSQEQINNPRVGDLTAHKQLMMAERAAQPTPTVNLHTMPITDEMRQDINRNGMPLFAKGGEVDADKNLQAFLKDSKVKTRMYHGTNKDFARFRRPEHGNFVSPDSAFANKFARTEGGNVMPVYVRATNPWDFDNPEHMYAVKYAAASRPDKAFREISDMESANRYGLGNWAHIEHPDVQDIIKGLGHDSYYTRENGVKNLAVYDPRNIKSAIGNQGTYDPESADIRKAKGGEVDTDTLRTALALRKKPKPAPQDAALEKARLNAIRMLGLHENNTPEDRAKALGFAHDFYHGTERMDRLLEKPYIDPKRATSGPMPYGTDNPVVASNYATSKADTSRISQDEGSLEHYFQVHPKALGLRGSVPYSVERSFYFLPPEVKQEIHAKAPNIGYEDPDQAEGAFVAHPTTAGALTSKDHYDYILKREARGNPLTALRIMFGDNGELIGNEHKLADVFKAAGYPHPISQVNAPWSKAEGVFTGKVRATNPLYTHDTEHLQKNVIPALEKALARDRTRLKPGGADMWAKDSRFTPKDWLKQLKDDVGKGVNSFVWTSIPDKVTAALRGLGHDAIVDTGGKSDNAAGHTVTIPFNPEQVRSRFAAYDPEKIGEKGLLLAQGGTVQTQNNLITTLAQRLGMTPAAVMQAIQQQPQGLAEGGQPEKKRKSKKKGRLSLSDLMQLSQTGAEEAPDLPIKEFVNPGHDMIPEGGVQMPNGAPFPMGPQQQAQAAQQQTGIPGQVQGGAPLAAIAAMLHQGPAGAPQPGQPPGQGNMLALTHQGQAMQAMKPPMPQPPVQRPMPPRPGMPAMAKGGKVKMSTADMRRALEARKRKTK